MRLRIDAIDPGKVQVSLLRADKEDPHRLSMQFTMDKEAIASGKMCFVLYWALRDEMLAVLKEASGDSRAVDQSLGSNVKRTVRRVR
jgi:hypothetical protein